MDDERIDLGLRYREALHGIQTATAFEMVRAVQREERHPATEPKHLRVGVDSAMCEGAALQHLLIAKGIITLDEWVEALRRQVNHELATYESRHMMTFR